MTNAKAYFNVNALCDIGAFERDATAERPPQLSPQRAVLPDDTIRLGLPRNVFFTVIARDGVFLRDPAEIGVQ